MSGLFCGGFWCFVALVARLYVCCSADLLPCFAVLALLTLRDCWNESFLFLSPDFGRHFKKALPIAELHGFRGSDFLNVFDALQVSTFELQCEAVRAVVLRQQRDDRKYRLVIWDCSIREGHSEESKMLQNHLFYLAEFVDKHSEIAEAFNVMTSDAFFKLCEGEWERLLKHLKHPEIDMTDAQVARIKRAYKRRMLDCECPGAARHCLCHPRRLLLLRRQGRTDRPGQRAFVSNAELIFQKDIKYAQKGLLSDLPGVQMYRHVGKLVTGFALYRGHRNSSALEGMHLHYRFSQHLGASHTGPIRTASSRDAL
ncbi:hypothetical protein M885DRAFT_607790 [Pelagophyceae sp. CCMP2097]|nr:hypothetical protein M885DRAFT_607790 [Pelagophyceae sp. CCMP2097]